MKRTNEANALQALIGIIPMITGCTYSSGGMPDDSEFQHKEVDLLLIPDSAGFPNLAVEHTVVEAYRGQKTYLNRSYKIVKALDVNCSGLLPADRTYGLLLPPELVATLQRARIRQFVTSISPWVTGVAKSMRQDDTAHLQYDGYQVLLLCNGSIPEYNGTVGRLPGVPKIRDELLAQSLWLAIEHAVGKFTKYEELDYSLVLVIENISGLAHPSTLNRLAADPRKKAVIDRIDFIIEFASNQDRMIVGNVWKEKSTLYNQVPYNRRFTKNDGQWTSFG